MGIKSPIKSKGLSIVYSVGLIAAIIIMLMAIRYTVIKGHEEVKETVVTNIGKMLGSFRSSADEVMRDAGQEIIRLKAEKIAKDIENYLILNPGANIKSLQADPEFQPIAIQQIGKTGYSAVHESKTFINRFHTNPKIINFDLHKLEHKFPDFWKILIASKDGENNGGYYNWPEANGTVREKYMWVAKVSSPTADGIFLDVAATTYIDEFLQPFERLNEKLNKDSIATSAKVSNLSESIQHNTLVASVGIILLFCCILGYMAFRLISDFRRIELEINERKKAEVTLRQSEHSLKQLIDFLPDPTFGIDGDKRITVWNRAIEKMTGVPATEMIGKGDHVYTIPFYGEPRPHLMDLLWESDSELEKKYQHVNKEGDNLIAEVFCPALYGGKGAYVYAKAASLRDLDGNIIGAIEAVRDITESKKAEDELRASERKMVAMSQAVEDALVMINGKGKVLFWNPAAEKLFGYTAKEAMGMDFHSMAVSEEISNKASTGIEHFSKTGEGKVIGTTIENIARNRDGKEFPVEVTVSSFQIDDEWFAVGTVRDITTRKNAEEDMKKNIEELERFSMVVIDREKKMIGLKEEINELLASAGKENKYKIVE